MQYLTIACLLLSPAHSPWVLPGAQSLRPDAATERELRALRDQLLDAVGRGDKLTLEKLLADGFVFVHSTGVLEHRSEYIERVAAGAQAGKQGSNEFLADDLRIYGGDTVVWVTRSRRRAAGGSQDLNFRGTDVLVKYAGRWQWVSVHSTRLPTRPQAVALDAAAYAAIVGDYEIGPNRVVRIRGDARQLRVEAAGARPAELIAASATEFVWFDEDSNVDARLVVVKDSSGMVSAVVLRRDGSEVWKARRVR